MCREHLVTCELIGPFNEEGMLAWITEIKTVVNSLDGKRFCALVDHRQHRGWCSPPCPHLQGYLWVADTEEPGGHRLPLLAKVLPSHRPLLPLPHSPRPYPGIQRPPRGHRLAGCQYRAQ